MRIKRFRVALLLTLIVALLIVPTVLTISLLSVSPASASPDGSEIQIVRGKDTAYNIDIQGPLPWVTYEEGDRPPLMVAKEVSAGKAVTAGFIPGFRDGDWNRSGNPDPHLPELLDATFQWMVPGATTVLWYEGYGVFNNTANCAQLVTALTDLGYTITGKSTTPITSSLLTGYDILIIPQLQLGSGTGGGDPSLLPDDDVAAIKGFAEGGKGVLVAEATDFHPYQYHKVHNKILMALGFEYLFQPDSVYDEDYNIAGANYRAIVDVDPTTAIGSAYQSATGKTTIGLYGYCSLAKAGPGVDIKVIPEYQVGMPGTSLEYTVMVFNPENPLAEDLTFDIAVTDNADWSPSLSSTSLSVPIGENRTATLTVTIPPDTPLSIEDEITVLAVERVYPEVMDSVTCLAYAGMRIEPTDDAYVFIEEPDANYGDLIYLYTGRYGETGLWQHAYLQFDLSAIPPRVDITDARLYLFCFTVWGTQVPIACTEVEDDIWTELTITWNDKPENGPVLDLELVAVGLRGFPIPYSWDVTSFVDQELKGDQLVSLCVRGLENHPLNVNESFESKDWPYENRVHPFLRVSYTEVEENLGVSVSISPSENSRPPGEDATFTVTVTNTGNVSDTYSLTTADNAGWTRSISPQTLSLAEGGSGTATLTVTIPSGAEHGTRDSITVTATSQTDDTVSDSASCTAQAVIARGVEVSISPTSGSGSLGEEVAFTVTVTNTGEAEDTYDLTASDNADWGATISPTSLTVTADGSQTTTVSVTIPSDAADGDSTRITVTATSRGDSTKWDSAACTATAEAAAAEGFPIVYPVVAVVIIVVIIAVVLIRKPF